MPLTSIITEYNSDWPQKYLAEKQALTPVFGEELVEIHHVGSTAVPGLAAKPEIDILVVVRDTSMVDRWEMPLDDIGYRRGGDLSVGHLFFKRDVKGVRSHKIHICKLSHNAINELLLFRNYLRSNRERRVQYVQLKLKLQEENRKGIAEYLEGKVRFIQSVLARAREE